MRESLRRYPRDSLINYPESAMISHCLYQILKTSTDPELATISHCLYQILKTSTYPESATISHCIYQILKTSTPLSYSISLLNTFSFQVDLLRTPLRKPMKLKKRYIWINSQYLIHHSVMSHLFSLLVICKRWYLIAILEAYVPTKIYLTCNLQIIYNIFVNYYG